jgi:GTP-binding protein
MNQLRNIAIIAPCRPRQDTIVDALLRQSGVFRENEQVVSQVMDSNDLERERGITILAKNTAIRYGDTRINIVDTPDTPISAVKSNASSRWSTAFCWSSTLRRPMPQTRFVLRKALEMHLKPIVVINKVDRPDARPMEVLDLVLELFIELGATDEQLDFPVIYASGRLGLASAELAQLLDALGQPVAVDSIGFKSLLETICDHVPSPLGDDEMPLQMLVSNIDYDNYIGRIAIGRIERGCIARSQNIVLCGYDDGSLQNAKIVSCSVSRGLRRVEIDGRL